MAIPVNMSQANKAVNAYLNAGLVPLLIGSPGLGKSDLMKAIAKQKNLEVIDLRLSQCDPCDLAGFPTVEGGKADYMPMKHFPIKGDPIPKGKDGWLLFLDEITSASPAIQAASYKLVLDRMVGSHHLHDKVFIVAAGNKATDGAIVEDMSTALQSRLVHLELAVHFEQWIEWAIDNGIDTRIISYIRFKPDNIYTFRPDHSDQTYACPRTWEFANRLMKEIDFNDPLSLPMLAGTLGEGVAREFIAFCEIYAELPTIDEILKKPDTVQFGSRPDIHYALVGSVASHMTADNAEQLMKFIKRLPTEFQVICLRDTVRRNMDLLKVPAYMKWINEAAPELFGRN